MTLMYIISPYILVCWWPLAFSQHCGDLHLTPTVSHLRAPRVHNAHGVPFLNKHLQCGRPRPCSLRPIRDSRATEPVSRPVSHTTLTRLPCSYCIAPLLTFKPPMVPTFQRSRAAEVTTTFLAPPNQCFERLIPRPALPGPLLPPTQPCNHGPTPAEETAVKREKPRFALSGWVGSWP